MKAMELRNLQSGDYVQSVKTGEVLEVVGMEAGKYMLSNGKVYTESTIKRWWNIAVVEELDLADNTDTEETTQVEDTDTTADTEEQQDTDTTEETEQVEELSQDNSENMYRKNLEFKYRGDIM